MPACDPLFLINASQLSHMEVIGGIERNETINAALCNLSSRGCYHEFESACYSQNVSIAL